MEVWKNGSMEVRFKVPYFHTGYSFNRLNNQVCRKCFLTFTVAINFVLLSELFK